MTKNNWTLYTCSGVCALIMLDTNVVAVSLPSIARSLNASFVDVEWVVSAYMLASIKPQMMQNRPAENSSAPSGSKLALEASFDSAPWRRTSSISTATTGRFR